MKKKLVFGIGTGRCGSASLAYLMSHQIDAHASHELFPILPWETDLNLLTKKWEQLDHQSHLFDVVFDSGSYYFPYVPILFNSWSQHDYANQRFDLKIVCLKRDKNQTIQSYLRKFEKQNNNPLQNHDGTKYYKSEWDLSFPKYDGVSIEESLSLYYDQYYSVCDFWESKYSGDFKIFNTEALNTTQGVKSILEFIGIENPKIVTNIQKRKH
tara:strand:- start:4312 stop:4947 length:636 start_codon:yes stop_codon:yes gene_type:complete